MSEELKLTKPSESAGSKPEDLGMEDEKKTDTQVQAIQGEKRILQNSEVVKKAELDLHADPNDPKDPKEQQAYD